MGTRWRHQGWEKKNNGPQTATHRPRTRAAGKSRPESPLKPHDLREGAAKRQNAPPESPCARGGVGARASRGRWRGSIGDGSGSSRQDRQERECARPAWPRPPAPTRPAAAPAGATRAPRVRVRVPGSRGRAGSQKPSQEESPPHGPRAARGRRAAARSRAPHTAADARRGASDENPDSSPCEAHGIRLTGRAGRPPPQPTTSEDTSRWPENSGV